MNSIFTYISTFLQSKWAAITHGAASSVLTVTLILSGVPHWISAAVVVAITALMHWAHFDGGATSAPVATGTQTTTVTAGNVTQTTVAPVVPPKV